MKHIWAAVSLFAAVMSVYSCKVDESDKGNVNIVEEAYVVYHATVQDVLLPVLGTLDAALKADMYLKAENDSARYALEDRFFESGNVRVYEDRLTVVSGYEPLTVVFDSLSICEEGAVWKSSIRGVEARISAVGECEWTVDVDLNSSEFGVYKSLEELSMTVSAYHLNGTPAVIENGFFFEFESSGRYTETGKIVDYKEGILVEKTSVLAVEFATSEPTKATSVWDSAAHFYDGGFSIHLEAEAPVKRSEDITVILSPSRFNTRVQIEYMDMTGVWVE